MTVGFLCAIMCLDLKKSEQTLRRIMNMGIISRFKDIMAANEAAMPNDREMAVLREHFPACFRPDGSFDLERFKELSTVILANRSDNAIADIPSQIYTRDIFRKD